MRAFTSLITLLAFIAMVSAVYYAIHLSHELATLTRSFNSVYAEYIRLRKALDNFKAIPKGYYELSLLPDVQCTSEEVLLKLLEIWGKRTSRLLKFGVFDCSEVAAFTEWFLQDLGFEAGIVLGKVSGSWHAWNFVKLGEDEYLVDMTKASLPLTPLGVEYYGVVLKLRGGEYVSGWVLVEVMLENGTRTTGVIPIVTLNKVYIEERIYDNIYEVAEDYASHLEGMEEWDWWNVTSFPPKSIEAIKEEVLTVLVKLEACSLSTRA